MSKAHATRPESGVEGEQDGEDALKGGEDAVSDGMLQPENSDQRTSFGSSKVFAVCAAGSAHIVFIYGWGGYQLPVLHWYAQYIPHRMKASMPSSRF